MPAYSTPLLSHPSSFRLMPLLFVIVATTFLGEARSTAHNHASVMAISPPLDEQLPACTSLLTDGWPSVYSFCPFCGVGPDFSEVLVSQLLNTTLTSVAMYESPTMPLFSVTHSVARLDADTLLLWRGDDFQKIPGTNRSAFMTYSISKNVTTFLAEVNEDARVPVWDLFFSGLNRFISGEKAFFAFINPVPANYTQYVLYRYNLDGSRQQLSDEINIPEADVNGFTSFPATDPSTGELIGTFICGAFSSVVTPDTYPIYIIFVPLNYDPTLGYLIPTIFTVQTGTWSGNGPMIQDMMWVSEWKSIVVSWAIDITQFWAYSFQWTWMNGQMELTLNPQPSQPIVGPGEIPVFYSSSLWKCSSPSSSSTGVTTIRSGFYAAWFCGSGPDMNTATYLLVDFVTNTTHSYSSPHTYTYGVPMVSINW